MVMCTNIAPASLIGDYMIHTIWQGFSNSQNDSHKGGKWVILSSGYVKIAIENGHLQWIFPLQMVIFHSYVSLPEGTFPYLPNLHPIYPCTWGVFAATLWL